MNFNTKLPGLEEVTVTRMEDMNDVFRIFVEIPKQVHTCPVCEERTCRVHDYRTQKVQHLKLFERTTYLYYRRRRYVCTCGKRFAESNPIVERYKRHTKEWNQALGLRAIQGMNFKDTAAQFRTSLTTAMRRFDEVSVPMLKKIDQLPEVIAFDEYKGDTSWQVPSHYRRRIHDILPERSIKTVKQYLLAKGDNVQMVIMDMSHSFKSAVQKALGDPIIVADRFHFSQ